MAERPSQAVESQNGHISDARALDLPNSALWVTQLEARRFNRYKEACLARTDVMPPKILRNFSELKAYAYLPNNAPSASATEQGFLVKTTPTLTRTVTLIFQRDAAGDIVSYFGKCSCGTPSCQNFPCNHQKTIATARNLDENLLILLKLTTARWREQYPMAFTVCAPTMDGLKARDVAQVGVDVKLRLPVIAPPKRGRPRTKLVRHDMEVSM